MPTKPAAPAQTDPAVAAEIDAKIAVMTEAGDWRGPMLAKVRSIVHAALPDVLEELKWRGVPCWSHQGLISTGETYKQVVKMTFAHGASLPDPKQLFNASLDGGTRRAIDLREGDSIDEAALKALVRAAAEFNALKKADKAKKPAAGK